MKQKLKQIAANYCVWYFLSVLLSIGTVILLVFLWGDRMQDWMYLRHQGEIPSDWLLMAVLILLTWNLRVIIEKGIRRIVYFIKLSKRNRV